MGDSDCGAPGNQGEFALRIVRGRPGEEELAALTAVLLVLRSGGAKAAEEAGGPSNDPGWWRGPDVAPRAPHGPR
ncbi:acyl-CoA carboxylase subunit epsilon [Streptomyces sp. NRRL B-1140]|uniref:acyl-CoA carboxylase subunit epsilon n=1 Tax=Streptomyces sp. NRRL B-1140 TaxID=1415549 RepID=UPI0006B032AD|nr:acyl-CoA carboxylase subunit epsilon [Streptomyces sp. NRRL B-1140]